MKTDPWTFERGQGRVSKARTVSIGSEHGNGGFEMHGDGRGGLVGTIWCVENVLPETPRPCFQLEIDGVTYQGQAWEPPQQDEHGRIVFHLEMKQLAK